MLLATPAIVGNQILVRTRSHLVAIAPAAATPRRQAGLMQ
jgi:hypothetical protein